MSAPSRKNRSAPPEVQSRLLNRSPAKALAVLEVSGPDRQSMTLPAIAAAAGISQSAAQRLTHTLDRLGYLRKDRRLKTYALAPRILQLKRFAKT